MKYDLNKLPYWLRAISPYLITAAIVGILGIFVYTFYAVGTELLNATDSPRAGSGVEQLIIASWPLLLAMVCVDLVNRIVHQASKENEPLYSVFDFFTFIMLGLSAALYFRQGAPVLFVFGVWFALFSFWLPSVVANIRKHPNRFPVFLTNFLLGWSGIGWLVALIWASTTFEKNQA